MFLTFFLCKGRQLQALDNLLLLRLLGLEILDPVLYGLLGPGQGLLFPADAAQELLVLPPPPLRLLGRTGGLLQLGLQVVHQAVHVGDTLLVRHLHRTVARAVNENSRSFTVPREGLYYITSLKSLRLRKLLTFGYVWFLPYSPYFAYLSLAFLSFPYLYQALQGLTGPYFAFA